MAQPISKNQAARRRNNPSMAGANSSSTHRPAPKLTQTTLFGKSVASPRIINVKKQSLVKLGYRDLEHWLEDSNHVYIGRTNTRVKGAIGSQWGNPYPEAKFGRAECIAKFRQYVIEFPGDKLRQDLVGLKGKTLGCWCKPDACHGDVLLEFLKAIEADDNVDGTKP